jgi:hypothetical protein
LEPVSPEIEEYLVEEYLVEEYLVEEYLVEEYLVEEYPREPQRGSLSQPRVAKPPWVNGAPLACGNPVGDSPSIDRGGRIYKGFHI